MCCFKCFQYPPLEPVTNARLPFWQAFLRSQDVRLRLENTSVEETSTQRVKVKQPHPVQPAAVLKYSPRQLQTQNLAFCYQKNPHHNPLRLNGYRLCQTCAQEQIPTAPPSDSKSHDYKITALTLRKSALCLPGSMQFCRSPSKQNLPQVTRSQEQLF